VHAEQNSQGARVRITETIDGEARTRAYEGASLEEILRAHPELERDLAGLRIRAEAGTGLDLSLELGGRAELTSPSDPSERRRLVPKERSRPIITDRLGVMVRPLEAESARPLGLEHGLLVERTYPGTYAQLLGVGAGCILLELDGVPLREVVDIERALRARQPDAALRLVWLDVLGQRQEKTWTSQPDAAPAPDAAESQPPR
jgi:hypothetical protein